MIGSHFFLVVIFCTKTFTVLNSRTGVFMILLFIMALSKFSIFVTSLLLFMFNNIFMFEICFILRMQSWINVLIWIYLLSVTFIKFFRYKKSFRITITLINVYVWLKGILIWAFDTKGFWPSSGTWFMFFVFVNIL